jgi:hypothetical protein
MQGLGAFLADDFQIGFPHVPGKARGVQIDIDPLLDVQEREADGASQSMCQFQAQPRSPFTWLTSWWRTK